MRRRWIMLLISVVLLAGAGITGYTLARDEPRLREEAELAEEVGYKYEGVKIVKDATVRWEYTYEMCGHTDVVETIADAGMAGMTFTELQETYPDARIVTFNESEIVLARRFACYCPEHFLLKKYGDELAIYCTKAGTDEQRVFRLVHMTFNTIETGERAVLTTGRVFDSIVDVEAYIRQISEKSARWSQ